MSGRTADYDFDLPPGRIARVPSPRRDGARLLVHDVPRDATRHAVFAELPAFLEPGDLLVLNATRVIPARLHARRRSGGAVELLFLEPQGEGLWSALVQPARRLRAGEELEVPGTPLVVRLVERPRAADGAPERHWTVRLSEAGAGPGGGDPTLALLERHGRMPLPPYVGRDEAAARDEEDALEALDRERYQTVYARDPGAVAAPTAGLHFTPELLAALAARGVRTATVTLHVGLGTFLPVAAERIEDHVMHAERYELAEECVQAIAETRGRKGRVVAVGTTSVRVLESVAGREGGLRAARGETRLFLRPGSRFRVVDDLITNFHLPRSTLLMLVAAFAGRERVLRLYAEAVERGYRFYSYGDAMLLRRRG